MKRQSTLKDNVKGVGCEATVDAFNSLTKEGRKPRVFLKGHTNYVVRVHIGKRYFDYSPTTGKFSSTYTTGMNKWFRAGDPKTFHEMAQNICKGNYPPTDKMLGFLEHLCMVTGEVPDEDAFDFFRTCSSEIARLKKIKEDQNDESICE
jgi:hypothetical protein